MGLRRYKRATIKSTAQKSDIDKVLKVQCYNGNWNYDPYMLGLANGLILAKALLDGKCPVFLESPDKWGKDEKSNHALCRTSSEK